MLKLLLSHWQSHREPLPFVLTDDPLYCSHITKSPFPEVYSVNRINPIFEEDEERASNLSIPPPSHSVRKPSCNGPFESEQFKTYPADRKAVKSKDRKDPFKSNFLLRKPISKPILNESEYSLNSHFRFYSPDSILETNSNPALSLKRSLSEERREEESKSSDDTGYSSSGQFKSLTTLESDGSVEIHPMSSDSDDCSRPEAVIVSADVHRVSTPDDILVRSPSSGSSANYSYRSYGSSPEPFDSLTMSSITDVSSKDADIKRPNSVVREKLQKLLEKGNPSREDKKTIVNNDEMEILKTRHDLMKSLTRALNNKVPKRDPKEPVVTRSDDTNTKPSTIDRKSTSSSTSPKTILTNSDSTGVTRQDESNSSSLSSFTKVRKPHLHRNLKHSSEKELKSIGDSSDSQKTHKCKICENAHRPLAFHQLLPGHWSYDNVYLPQIHNVMCPCMHPHPHGLSVPPSSDDDVFYPMFYHQDLGRVRHSWAPYTNGHNHKTEDKGVSTSSKENSSSHTRYSPDGETDSSNTSSNKLKKSFSERRSLREPKKCKCEHCLDSDLDKSSNPHDCTCYCLAHRRVKFASDSDISQHRHFQSFRLKDALANGEQINAALVMNLPHLNGHVPNKGNGKENGKSKKTPTLIPRGLKEPVKVSIKLILFFVYLTENILLEIDSILIKVI